MQCEYFALEGLSDLVNTIKQVHANLNPALEVIGILRVMFDPRITLADAGQRAAQGALRRQGVRHRDPAQRPPGRGAELRHARRRLRSRRRRARSPSSSSRARWRRAPTRSAPRRSDARSQRRAGRAGDDAAGSARIEDAGINASAPREQRWIDGWLVRLSPGKAKRARCIQPVAPGGSRHRREARAVPSALCRRRAAAVRADHAVLRSRPGSTSTSPRSAWRGSTTAASWSLASLDAFRTGAKAPCATTASRDRDRRGRSLRRMGRRRARLVGRASARARRAHRASRRCRITPSSRATGAASPSPAARSAIDGRVAGLYDIFTTDDARGRGHAERVCRHLLGMRGDSARRPATCRSTPPTRSRAGIYRRLGFADGYSYHYRTPADGAA